MNPFSPLKFIKQNKLRCILLMVMLVLSAVIYVGGLYVTGPESTVDFAVEQQRSIVPVLDGSVVTGNESRFDEFIEEVTADGSCDYIYRGNTGGVFSWNTVMDFSCGYFSMTFATVDDFKKHCEHFGIEVDYSKIREGSIVMSELLASNLGLSVGDKLDESSDSENMEIYEGYSFTVDYLTKEDGYPAYFITGNENPSSAYIYGKTVSDDALWNKVAATAVKYNCLVDFRIADTVDEEFSSFYFIYGFVVILVSIILAITINTAFSGMYQKRNFELAVYRAIGISKKKIFRKLVLELLLIDAIALFVGAAAVLLFLYLFNNLVLYPEGLYLNYFHPFALAAVVICNLLSILPLALFRIRQINKADICEY